MYKHILVPLAFDTDDASDRALDAARILADDNARITLLHVREAVPAYALSYMPEGYSEELNDTLRTFLKTRSDKIENSVPVLVSGHAGRTILDWAEANNVDCIIISSHRPGLEDYFLGSTAARVARHSQCSVHVLR